MSKNLIKLDVDHIGSQDPTHQPTAEDFAALSRYFQEQKKRRLAEVVAPKESSQRRVTPKAAWYYKLASVRVSTQAWCRPLQSATTPAATHGTQ